MNIPISLVSRYIGSMTYTINDIEQLALALSYDERAELLERIQLSLEIEFSPEESDQFWLQQAGKRLKELNDGTVKSLSHHEVMADLRKEFGWS
jgi:putative addiction module component (TIGR02574 family)